MSDNTEPLHILSEGHPHMYIEEGYSGQRYLRQCRSQTESEKHGVTNILPDQSILYSLDLDNISHLQPHQQVDHLSQHLRHTKQYQLELLQAVTKMDKANRLALDEQSKILRTRWLENMKCHPLRRDYSDYLPGHQAEWYESYLKFAFRYEEYPEPSPRLKVYMERLEMCKLEHTNLQVIERFELWSAHKEDFCEDNLALEDERMEYEYALECFRHRSKMQKLWKEETDAVEKRIKRIIGDLAHLGVTLEKDCEKEMRCLSVSDPFQAPYLNREKRLAKRDSVIDLGTFRGRIRQEDEDYRRGVALQGRIRRHGLQ